MDLMLENINAAIYPLINFKALFSLMRPRHWFKSIFVMIGYFFSGLWHSHFLLMLTAALTFCFASSAVYIYNDVSDLLYDKYHPKKQYRPLVTGAVPISFAILLMAFLVALSFSLSFLLSNSATLIISTYLMINVFYSKKLKFIPYLDVLCIGSGFMLRILMGTIAINIVPSYWLLLCGTSMSLFLAFSKRQLELNLLNSSRLYQTNFRPVLQHYNPSILKAVLFLSGVFSYVSYFCYVVHMSDFFFNGAIFFYTLPIVFLGFIRYLYLMQNNYQCTCPIDLFLSDRWLVLSLLGFILLNFFILR